MNNYLKIADSVLAEVRRPMSARAIMKKGFSLGIIPSQLHGRTQHKTLQARLSEDILYRRTNSLFFRTRPGQFFLRRFITDSSIPVEFRQEMTARRRSRDLLRGPALSVDRKSICSAFGQTKYLEADVLLSGMRDNGWYRYTDPKKPDADFPLLWAFAAVTKGKYILSHRPGKYRDSRDHFAQKRSIGFATLVTDDDRSLFDIYTFGIADTALAAVNVDLDIPVIHPKFESEIFRHNISFLSWSEKKLGSDLLAFVEVQAPNWFEPVVSRLSLNDLKWMDLSMPPNNVDDFDPWSRLLLSRYFSNL